VKLNFFSEALSAMRSSWNPEEQVIAKSSRSLQGEQLSRMRKEFPVDHPRRKLVVTETMVSGIHTADQRTHSGADCPEVANTPR